MHRNSPSHPNQRGLTPFKRVLALATVGAAVLSSAVTVPADAASIPKKGAACPKSKVGTTEIGARKTPYICTKSGKSQVWRLTSAGGGSAASSSSKIPQAWAGTFSYTAESYTDVGNTNAPITVTGTIWLGLTEGDAKAAYYNQMTMTWDAKTVDGTCVSAGTADGGSQLAMYDSSTRGNLSLSSFFKLTCANGLTINSAMQAFSKSANGLPATSSAFKGTSDYTLRDYYKAADAQPKANFTFSLTPSTLDARPPSPQRGGATPSPVPES